MEEVILPGYTRVTEILRTWNDFSKILPEVLEHKRQIGERVHDAIDQHNRDLIVDPYFEGREYFNSFLLWLATTGATVVQSEKRMYDDYFMITGKIDALVQFPHEDKLILVDWKTSASCDKKTALSWQMQGTLYHYLLTKNHTSDDVSDKFLFVKLSDEGALPRLKEFSFEPRNMAYSASAIETYRYFNP
jgi:ATP-dependent exoDNAse (exonuclease V) beta subunit